MNNTGNKNVTSDFLRVLLTLKKNIFRDLNVAEVGVIGNIDGDDINVTLFADGTNILCKKLSQITLKSGDVAVIIFAGHSFATNANRVKNNQLPVYSGDSETLHTRSTGIIIGTL